MEDEENSVSDIALCLENVSDPVSQVFFFVWTFQSPPSSGQEFSLVFDTGPPSKAKLKHTHTQKKNNIYGIDLMHLQELVWEASLRLNPSGQKVKQAGSEQTVDCMEEAVWLPSNETSEWVGWWGVWSTAVTPQAWGHRTGLGDKTTQGGFLGEPWGSTDALNEVKPQCHRGERKEKIQILYRWTRLSRITSCDNTPLPFLSNWIQHDIQTLTNSMTS